MGKPAEYELHELYGGEVKIRYYPNSHQYKLDGEKATLISPSKLANLFDPFDGMDWALGMARKEFEKNLDGVTGKIAVAEMRILIEKALSAAADYTQDTIDVGNAIHALCEQFADAKIAGEEFDIDATLDLIEDERVMNGFMGFCKWYASHDVEFVRTESLVYSRRLRVAGRQDLKARVDGILNILDFKTGSLRAKQFFQVSCYWEGENEEAEFLGLEKPEQAQILNFNRDGVFVEPVVITKEMHESLLPLIEAGLGILEKVKELKKIMDAVTKTAYAN